MVSLEIAKQLKAAGLLWQPVMHDFFAIPDRGLDHERFVISDMTVYVELLRGWPIATFHGTSEWALDYIYLQELVWMPTEEQIREALASQLAGEPQPAVHLFGVADEYRCEIHFQGQTLAFTAEAAGDAYASALIYVLRVAPGPNGQLS
jgi:hypothetical protein